MNRTKAKIVCLGGGTGLSFLLRGLKLVASDLTAVVTLTPLVTASSSDSKLRMSAVNDTIRRP